MNRLRAVPFVLVLAFGCSSTPTSEPTPTREPTAASQPSQSIAPPEPGTTTTVATDPRLEAFARERSLQTEERRALAVHYVRSARARMEELDYAAATRDLERAIELDPDDAEARLLLDRVRAADPQGSREYRGTIEALANERKAKIEQDRIDTERLFSEGVLLVEKQQYDQAIRRFERVLEAIRWTPYDVDLGSLEARTRSSLARAREASRARSRR